MTILYTKQQAMDELPFIEDKNLYKALNFALWLYLDQRRSLKYSVNKAAEKHCYKPKISIERLMRQVIPEEVIWERVSNAKSTNPNILSRDSAIRNQKMKKLELDGKRHVRDIAKDVNYQP